MVINQNLINRHATRHVHKNITNCSAEVDITTTGESFTSLNTKNINTKKRTRPSYISPNQIPAFSAVSENRVNYTRAINIPSSFPYTANLYKTDLDKFLASAGRLTKEIKKSDVTLCKDPKPIQHLWSDSEGKGSDYCERECTNKKKVDVRTKRLNRKTKAKAKDSEYYALDEIYSSQFHLELDGKSTSTCKNNTSRRKSVEITNTYRKNLGSQDVWSVIRNINKFQFKPSPAISEDSVITTKRKRYGRKHNESLVGAWRAKTNNIVSKDFDQKPRNFFPSVSTFYNTTTIGSDKIDKESVDRSKSLGRNRKASDQYNFNQYKLKSQIERINEQVERKMKENNIKEMGDCAQSQNKKITTYKSNRNRFCNIKNNKELRAAENKEIGSIKVYTENDNFSCSSKSEIINRTRGLKEETAQNTREKTLTNKSQIEYRTESPTRQRKQRLVTTMPRTSMIPKMTQKEIRRRLTEIKYPIVILGKDQTSPFTLNEYEHPQYSGMENHVWPFMTEWLKNKDKKKVAVRPNLPVNLTNKSKIIPPKKKITANIELTKVIKLNKNDKLKKPERKSPEAIEQEAHRKPIKSREKVIKFLYKNCSPMNYQTVEPKVEESSSQIKISCYNEDRPLMDVSTETIPEIKQRKTNSVMNARTNKRDLSKNMKRVGLPHKQWHDNVESVIEKIVSGVYFSDSQKTINPRYTKQDINPQEYINECEINENDRDEIITQASICNDDETNDEVQVLPLNEQKDVLMLIPGFDEILPPLEIETVRDSHVNVKHCVTSVIVQFDITVMGTNKLIANNQEVIICTPLVINEADNKIFRCETKIFNATLPAELCSILPKLMSGVFKTETDIDNTLSTAGCDMLIDVLNTPTIPRMTSFGCNLLINLSCTKMLPTLEQSATNICGLPILPIVTPCFTRDGNFQKPRITKGYFARYSVRAAQSNEFRTNNLLLRYDKFGDMHTLLPKFVMIFFHKHPLLLASIVQMRTAHDLSTNFDFNYLSNSQVVLTNSNTDIEPLIRLDDCNGLFFIDEEKIYKKHAHLAILPKSDDLQTVSQFDTEGKDEGPEAFAEGKKVQILHSTKKSRFIRLYRKCKSSCSINSKLMTPLDEIINLEKFLHVLGIGKMFSVFDSQQADKILSSISQMKKWLSEISSIQALLLLLLINKKETPNMLRYQSIILQGIAMNRITNASELDIEIELVESENFCKLNEYEGFSYMPASVENCNRILEEMCCIAKTTASNYHLSYDASSQQLLKSLVDKQQRLNPKYLKLMAKYAGLGLLKSKSNTNRQNEFIMQDK